MRSVFALMSRNRKLFFKDKGMLFSAMITPVILIVLYATFLAKIYRDSFLSAIPKMIEISDKLIDGAVACQLAASLLSVSCVTVTFCVNLTMVQDRANGTRKDFNISPISKSKIYLSYFLSTVLNSMMVNGIALLLCLGYVYKMGWYMNAADIVFIVWDEILLVLFGSTLSSIIIYPLTTQGQLSAVGTIVSAGYGFICGAYMPISNFGSGLRKILSYFPSTYGTSLVKNHMLGGIYREMARKDLPDQVIDAFKEALDCRLKFHGNVVYVNEMIFIMVGSIAVLGLVYFLLIRLTEKAQ
ncbi:MAG: ABC transporter permease [Lachnospiraceae bacterium]|nr:ABC transporter permease [Lachnospiraceae bacterium]